MSLCIICKEETNVCVNIHFKMVMLCQSCCNSITMQNVLWLCEENNNEDKEKSQ